MLPQKPPADVRPLLEQFFALGRTEQAAFLAAVLLELPPTLEIALTLSLFSPTACPSRGGSGCAACRRKTFGSCGRSSTAGRCACCCRPMPRRCGPRRWTGRIGR